MFAQRCQIMPMSSFKTPLFSPWTYNLTKSVWVTLPSFRRLSIRGHLRRGNTIFSMFSDLIPILIKLRAFKHTHVHAHLSSLFHSELTKFSLETTGRNAGILFGRSVFAKLARAPASRPDIHGGTYAVTHTLSRVAEETPGFLLLAPPRRFAFTLSPMKSSRPLRRRTIFPKCLWERVYT